MDDELIQRLTAIAETVADAEIADLPEDVQAAAAECPVFFATMEKWGPANDADEEDQDLLGLFTGASRLEPAPSSPEEAPRVTLFLDNLWWFAEESQEVFEEEVATTLLHELGHYFGWDEEEVAARGLE